MRVIEYAHPARDEPDTVKSHLVVTSVRVEEAPGHDHVHVWNRGAKSGTLVVQKGDGHRIARTLLPLSAAREAGIEPTRDEGGGG